MKKSILTSALLCLILLLSACSTTNPITGKKQFNTVSESEESRLGKKYHQLLIKQQGIMDDLIIEKKVNKKWRHAKTKERRGEGRRDPK